MKETTKFEYYVVSRRAFETLASLYYTEKCVAKEYISIHSFEDAVQCNWINEEGERVWVVPAHEEKMITSVWGFESLDDAISFHAVLMSNQIGMQCIDLDMMYSN